MVNKWLKIVQCLAKQCLQLPSYCLLCCQRSKRAFALCVSCEQSLPWLGVTCHRCALPLDDPANGCRCALKLPPYDALQAVFDYAWPVNRFIAKWKYGGQLHFTRLLAHFMVEQLTPRFPVDCIIPVPLHPLKLRSRGFNQSIELSQVIAKHHGFLLDRWSCTRTSHTNAQSHLSAQQRITNLHTASFAINKAFKAKHVLIIEDIVTTGATIRALTMALKRQGVQTVEIWCCCRTLKTAKTYRVD
jgi:ComF family protein